METPLPELDVRPVPPREQSPIVLSHYRALDPGEAFALVNDHDPGPLYQQFNAQFPGQFEWEDLARGPDLWRVRIGRRGGKR